MYQYPDFVHMNSYEQMTTELQKIIDACAADKSQSHFKYLKVIFKNFYTAIAANPNVTGPIALSADQTEIIPHSTYCITDVLPALLSSGKISAINFAAEKNEWANHKDFLKIYKALDDLDCKCDVKITLFSDALRTAYFFEEDDLRIVDNACKRIREGEIPNLIFVSRNNPTKEVPLDSSYVSSALVKKLMWKETEEQAAIAATNLAAARTELETANHKLAIAQSQLAERQTILETKQRAIVERLNDENLKASVPLLNITTIINGLLQPENNPLRISEHNILRYFDEVRATMGMFLNTAIVLASGQVKRENDYVDTGAKVIKKVFDFANFIPGAAVIGNVSSGLITYFNKRHKKGKNLCMASLVKSNVDVDNFAANTAICITKQAIEQGMLNIYDDTNTKEINKLANQALKPVIKALSSKKAPATPTIGKVYNIISKQVAPIVWAAIDSSDGGSPDSILGDTSSSSHDGNDYEEHLVTAVTAGKQAVTRVMQARKGNGKDKEENSTKLPAIPAGRGSSVQQNLLWAYPKSGSKEIVAGSSTMSAQQFTEALEYLKTISSNPPVTVRAHHFEEHDLLRILRKINEQYSENSNKYQQPILVKIEQSQNFGDDLKRMVELHNQNVDKFINDRERAAVKYPVKVVDGKKNKCVVM